jgi:hypothetical protein
MTARGMTMRRERPRRTGGEAAEQARKWRKWRWFGLLFAAGFAGGFAAGFLEEGTLWEGGNWPPAFAIAFAVGYTLLIVLGARFLQRDTDEFELARQYKAVAFAAGAYVLGYPVWFALWKGGLVAEPHHLILFGIFWLALAGSTLYYRNS